MVMEATRNLRESGARAYINNAAVKIFCGGMRREDVGRIEPPQKIIVVADAVPRQTGNKKRGKENGPRCPLRKRGYHHRYGPDELAVGQVAKEVPAEVHPQKEGPLLGAGRAEKEA